MLSSYVTKISSIGLVAREPTRPLASRAPYQCKAVQNCSTQAGGVSSSLKKRMFTFGRVRPSNNLPSILRTYKERCAQGGRQGCGGVQASDCDTPSRRWSEVSLSASLRFVSLALRAFARRSSKCMRSWPSRTLSALIHIWSTSSASSEGFPDALSVSTRSRWPATTRLASAAREVACINSRLLRGMRLDAALWS